MLQDSAQLVTLNQLNISPSKQVSVFVCCLEQTDECLCVLSSAPSFHSALRTLCEILEILLLHLLCTNISEHLKTSQLLLLQKFVVATLQQGAQAIWRFCSPLSACDRSQDLAQFLRYVANI